MEDDLKTSEALAVVWEVVKSNIPGGDKYDLLVEFDEVLGLGLGQLSHMSGIGHRGGSEVKVNELPADVQALIALRQMVRAEKNWDESDRLRDEILKLGYRILDTNSGMKVSTQ